MTATAMRAVQRVRAEQAAALDAVVVELRTTVPDMEAAAFRARAAIGEATTADQRVAADARYLRARDAAQRARAAAERRARELSGELEASADWPAIEAGLDAVRRRERDALSATLSTDGAARNAITTATMAARGALRDLATTALEGDRLWAAIGEIAAALDPLPGPTCRAVRPGGNA